MYMYKYQRMNEWMKGKNERNSWHLQEWRYTKNEHYYEQNNLCLIFTLSCLSFFSLFSFQFQWQKIVFISFSCLSMHESMNGRENEDRYILYTFSFLHSASFFWMHLLCQWQVHGHVQRGLLSEPWREWNTDTYTFIHSSFWWTMDETYRHISKRRRNVSEMGCWKEMSYDHLLHASFGSFCLIHVQRKGPTSFFGYRSTDVPNKTGLVDTTDEKDFNLVVVELNMYHCFINWIG